MPREVKERDMEDWIKESQRLNRIARASQFEGRSETWRQWMKLFCEIASMMILSSPESEPFVLLLVKTSPCPDLMDEEFEMFE